MKCNVSSMERKCKWPILISCLNIYVCQHLGTRVAISTRASTPVFPTRLAFVSIDRVKYVARDASKKNQIVEQVVRTAHHSFHQESFLIARGGKSTCLLPEIFGKGACDLLHTSNVADISSSLRWRHIALVKAGIGMCDSAQNGYYDRPLHIGAIFAVFGGSAAGVLFPLLPKVISNHSSSTRLNDFLKVFIFCCKWFGSGVILSTSLVHLLFDAFNALSPECLSLAYEPLSPLIVLCSLIVVLAFDFSLARLMYRKKVKATLENRGLLHANDQHERQSVPTDKRKDVHDEDVRQSKCITSEVRAQEAELTRFAEDRIAKDGNKVEVSYDNNLDRIQKLQAHADILIVESGIVFHSVIVGLTLGVATDPGFVPLLIAIIFHQACDGLGECVILVQMCSELTHTSSFLFFIKQAIGSRMAGLSYQGKRVQQASMILSYALITPIGIAIGIGVKYSFDPEKVSTQLAIGILDSIAAGVLLYGALVDVVAKECFGTGGVTGKPGLLSASNLEVAFAFGALLLGAGIMSLLGHWA